MEEQVKGCSIEIKSKLEKTQVGHVTETELGKVEEMRSEKWFVVLHYKDFGFLC